jgi:hypothetical protein
MGDSSQMCGGGWRNNVYTIVKQCEESQVPVAAPVPTVDRSSKFSWTDKGFSSPVKTNKLADLVGLTALSLRWRVTGPSSTNALHLCCPCNKPSIVRFRPTIAAVSCTPVRFNTT